MQTTSADAGTNPPNPATERGSLFQGGIASMVYGPWAVLPAMTEDLIAVWDRHLRGERADLAAIEAKLGRPLANEQRRYEVTRGVAVVPVEGVMAPKLNMMQAISGGASSQMVMRDVQAAAADPDVNSILLSIDSPGGSALGIDELARAVRAAAQQKPVVAHSAGLMASAAYWTGSAANGIYVGDPMAHVGSIGVVAMHRDVSGAEAKLGVKTTEITAGKYKRITSSYAPLSKEGRAVLQEMVDDCYSLFVDAVAAHRGVSVETVLERMADGRIFVGQRALDAGLADGSMTLDALIESMATDPAKYARRSVARIKPLDSKPTRDGGARAAASTPATGASMDDDNQGASATAPVITTESIKTGHPQVYAEILAAGAQQERERITAINAQAKKLPGHDKLIAQCIADGKSPGDTALALIEAEGTTLEAKAAAHAADAPQAVKASPTNVEGDGSKTKAQQRDEAKAYAAKHDVSFTAAMKTLGFAA